ncbi:MAG TPA: cytochrome ubiquinol oxidase subunit I [Phycisphaerae bacterium]|nr:cytochrome ubiquinol oxidase subunit I [Phycisphaerae bacterium]
MELDVVFLSRVQFALTIMFHYLFPPLTIGMSVVLVYLQAMHLRTKQEIYEVAARFWTQIFALNFALGVVTGIVMEFEFGTNWAAYSRYVGDVFGAALAAEGIFAFFLESGFLAILVFGWGKVSPRFHFFATLMVSLGSIFSAVWIIIANSWQQTPAGHRITQMIRNGKPWVHEGVPVMRAELVDFSEALLNPSTIDRITHTLIGAFIMGAVFVLSISAWYLLRGRHEDFARRSFSGALVLATVFSLAQLVSGHSNANMVAEYQPAKLAAFEGHFHTGPAAMYLFGWPNEEEQTVKGGVAVPGMLSLLVHNDPDAPVLGLDKFPRKYWPPVWLSFVSYHVMVLIGVFFIALTVSATFLLWRKKLFTKRWLLWIFVISVLPAVAANQLGWVAAEVGRQPWIVHPNMVRDDAGNPTFDENGHVRYVEEGLLTVDGISAAISGEQVLGSIIMFMLIYLMLGVVWVVVLNSKIQKGPQPLPVSTRSRGRGVVAAAAARTMHEGSMSEAKQPED